ncbi:thiopurine S-methyltransferase family protein [Verticillium dahliae]|nr:thiopurine S-methyltransferase family protein [Verticillium dahliae]
MSDHNSNKLSSTFAMSPLASHGPKWSALWEENRPNLVPPVTSSTASRPKALVPGCGKGHDVLLLAAFGYDVIGLDFAPAAASEAIENEKSVREAQRDGDKTTDVYKPKDGVPSVGTVSWATGDFFSNEWLEKSNISKETTFDLIFDYTFLCALPLSARPKWAARMAALLNPNGGRLPTTAPDGSINVPDIRPGGLRRLELVKPARTHKAGENEDGTVRDWLHVWSLVGA